LEDIVDLWVFVTWNREFGGSLGKSGDAVMSVVSLDDAPPPTVGAGLLAGHVRGECFSRLGAPPRADTEKIGFISIGIEKLGSAASQFLFFPFKKASGLFN
jgi:hypothetical protein